MALSERLLRTLSLVEAAPNAPKPFSAPGLAGGLAGFLGGAFAGLQGLGGGKMPVDSGVPSVAGKQIADALKSMPLAPGTGTIPIQPPSTGQAVSAGMGDVRAADRSGLVNSGSMAGMDNLNATLSPAAYGVTNTPIPPATNTGLPQIPPPPPVSTTPPKPTGTMTAGGSTTFNERTGTRTPQVGVNVPMPKLTPVDTLQAESERAYQQFLARTKAKGSNPAQPTQASQPTARTSAVTNAPKAGIVTDSGTTATSVSEARQQTGATPQTPAQVPVTPTAAAPSQTTAPVPTASPSTTPNVGTGTVTTTTVPTTGGGGGGGTPPSIPPQNSLPPVGTEGPPLIVDPPPGGVGPPYFPTLPDVATPTGPTTQLPGEVARTVNLSSFTPPAAGQVQERMGLPNVPQLERANIQQQLGQANTELPTVPTREMGNFGSYLEGNPFEVLSQDEIAEQAARLREIQTGRERTQIEQDRLANQQRYAQAISQAGTGKEAFRGELDQALQREMQRINANYLQRGIAPGTSNIQVEQDFNPLLQQYTKQLGAYLSGIENDINRLRLEGQISDQQAASALAELERQGGLLEAQALTDLQNRERLFGEQARQNRFGEFATTEGLERQASQDTFANQSQLAGLQEALRSNRLNEYLQQVGLNREGAQQDFANQLGLVNATEQMRQADIQRNLQERGQSLDEFSTQNQLNLSLQRLLEDQAQGSFNRDVIRRGEEREDDPNSFRNQLLAAQAQLAQAQANEALSSAQFGGLGFGDRYTISSNISSEVAALPSLIQGGQLTREAAQDIINRSRATYDQVNGSGAFDRDHANMVKAISGSGGAPENTNPVLYEANKAAAVRENASYQSELDDLTKKYSDAVASGSSPAALVQTGWPARIQYLQNKINANKSKYGL